MTQKEKFSGIYPALLTPFKQDNTINEKALAELIEMNIAKGVSGFYVGGSTAEAFLMSLDERKYVLDIVSDTVRERCNIISHIGCISTDAAIELGKHAKEMGADAVSSIPPFYYNFSLEEIKQYYFDIVNEVQLPMLVYNFPAFSGVEISGKTAGELLSDDRILGVKHTSNDFFALERMKSNFPDKLVLNGFDEMFLAGISMGADGGVGSTYNFMAEKFIKMRNLFLKGSMEEAQEIQRTVNTIIAALAKVGVMPAEKEILNMMGIELGQCRAPFKRVSEDEAEYLKKTVLPLLEQ